MSCWHFSARKPEAPLPLTQPCRTVITLYQQRICSSLSSGLRSLESRYCSTMKASPYYLDVSYSRRPLPWQGHSMLIPEPWQGPCDRRSLQESRTQTPRRCNSGTLLRVNYTDNCNHVRQYIYKIVPWPDVYCFTLPVVHSYRPL